MGQVRHGSATTTYAVRAAIQRSQASLAQLSGEFGINPKTVAKWRKRATVRGPEDRSEGAALDGPDRGGRGDDRRVPASHAAAAGRLPLRAAADDPAPDAVSPSPLPAAAWHLPLAGRRRGQAEAQKFKRYPIGFFHIDIAEVQTAEGKLYLFVGIDRTSKFAVTQLVEKANRNTASEFLQHCSRPCPIRSTRSSPTMASSSPSSRGTEHGPLPTDALRHDLRSHVAGCAGSSTASPSRTILGPTARSNG